MELEELQKSFLELQDKYKILENEKTGFEKKIDAIEAKNKSLQDTNHELFLRVTSPAKKEETPEEKTVSTTDIVEQYKKEHNIL